MNTEADFKKLLRLNKLVPFEELHTTHQAWLQLKELDSEYRALILDFPEFFAIIHTQEVADYLNHIAPRGNYNADRDKWSHFPDIYAGHCNVYRNPIFPVMEIEQFRKYVQKYPDGQKNKN